MLSLEDADAVGSLSVAFEAVTAAAISLALTGNVMLIAGIITLMEPDCTQVELIPIESTQVVRAVGIVNELEPDLLVPFIRIETFVFAMNAAC